LRELGSILRALIFFASLGAVAAIATALFVAVWLRTRSKSRSL
jgi:hypothetical protein